MTSIDFVLSPESTVRFYDVILCLARFGENVGVEANREKIALTALNSAKTTASSFTFEKKAFFQSYRFSLQQTLDFRHASGDGRFSCQILNKALLSAFKGRHVDSKDNDSSLERCEVGVKDGVDEAACRLTVRMVYKQGVKKTHKLTYEALDPPRVPFDRSAVRSCWKIGAYALRAFAEYFGAKTEHLDMFHDEGKMTFTSYAEKVVSGKEVLKQPLQTSIAIDPLEFASFDVEEKLHIGISVRDFKAIVAHADSLRASVTALYSQPSKPLLFTYSDHGLVGEFTLMTIGAYRGSSATPAPSVHRAKPFTLPSRSENASLARSQADTADMPPPPPRQGATSFTRDSTTSGVDIAQLRPGINEESLFVTEDDEEERRWGARTYEEDEGELRWDSGLDLRGNLAVPSNSLARQLTGKANEEAEDDNFVAPTQRMSQIRGLFD